MVKQKRIYKYLSVFLTLVLVLCMFPITAFAMQIFAKVKPDNYHSTLEVEQTDTIEDIKLKIEEKRGLAVENQKIFFNGQILEDDKELQDYSVQKDSTLMVLLTEEPSLDSNGYYQISNVSELYWFADYVNAGNTSANAVLTNDINVNENVLDEKGQLNTDTSEFLAWEPIGSYSNRYAGVFDGNSHSISGLYLESENSYQGFIGALILPGTIKNLGIKESYFNGKQYVGAICAMNYATISNCYNNSSVNGQESVGGICGASWGNETAITNCYNTGNVKSVVYYVGGICGSNLDGTILNCYNSGKVVGHIEAGGICGHNFGKITNCYNNGNIDANFYTGGVCGFNEYGQLENCYSVGKVFGASDIGGICAYSRSKSKIINCYYLDTSVPEKSYLGESKTTDSFENGEVTYLLNGDNTETAWGQKIGEDQYPVLNGSKIYAGYKDCGSELSYSNTPGELYDTKPEHQFGKWTSNFNSTHSRKCSVCNYKQTENCSGGNASYFEKAVCDICGEKYGKLITDETPPKGEITVGEYKWQNLHNSITYGVSFNGTQKVTITATDDSYTHKGYTDKKVVKISYYLYTGSEALTQDELDEITFTKYDGSFNIEPENEYVIYAKLVDYAGNTTYISSDCIVLDTTLPVITGIENGKTYCSAVEATVNDDNLDTVTINGENVKVENGKFTIEPAEGEQTVIATDEAGNSVTYIITVNYGHTFISYVSNNDATCTNDGTKTAKCEFCDATETVTDSGTATGHNFVDGKCTVCGDIDTDFNPVIIKGANGQWQKGIKDGLSFTSNAAFAHFLKVQVDGEDLDNTNYAVSEGSTIVTLYSEYLETLSVGTHTLAVISETGSAVTKFYINNLPVSDNQDENDTTTDITDENKHTSTNNSATTVKSETTTSNAVKDTSKKSPETGNSKTVISAIACLGVAAFSIMIITKKKKETV